MNEGEFRLLFDENISYRIIRKIAYLYPDSEQVKRLGLLSKKDGLIWEYARQHGFTIVTHDDDYEELSTLRGKPPKVIWLRTGNILTEDVATLLIKYADQIKQFISTGEEGCLELYQ